MCPTKKVASILNHMQVWNEQCPNEETLALVVRTGLCTTVGSMLRQVMAPANATDYFRDPFVKVRGVHRNLVHA